MVAIGNLFSMKITKGPHKSQLTFPKQLAEYKHKINGGWEYNPEDSTLTLWIDLNKKKQISKETLSQIISFMKGMKDFIPE